MTDNDRELLEWAARAAGIPHEGVLRDGGVFVVGGKEWNPLADDGDAFRLAVRLNMTLAVGIARSDEGECCEFELSDADPCAATRRAIVRAAAEVGKGMRPFPTADEIDQLAGMDDKPEHMK